MEEKEIVALFLARKEQAIAELGATYGKLCHKIAVNILKNESDADECVSDAYMGVWNTIPPERPRSLSAYVCSITRNIAISRYHRESAAKRNSHYDVALSELEDCIPATDTVEAQFESKELVGALNAFLGTLADGDQAMFVRRYWYAEPISAIAEHFGKSRHYISVRLARLREKLRKYLTEKGIYV